MEDTKTLVAGAASNQEQLASAAQSAVMTITRLADSVKQGAASLGSEQPEAQVLQTLKLALDFDSFVVFFFINENSVFVLYLYIIYYFVNITTCQFMMKTSPIEVALLDIYSVSSL